MRRFAKIADIVEKKKTCVNCVQSIVNMFYFRKYKFSSKLREHSLNLQPFLYICNINNIFFFFYINTGPAT